MGTQQFILEAKDCMRTRRYVLGREGKRRKGEEEEYSVFPIFYLLTRKTHAHGTRKYSPLFQNDFLSLSKGPRVGGPAQ